MSKDTECPLECFPAIDAEAGTRQANDLFKPYLFFHWKRGHKQVELWSSCCLKNGTMENPPRTVTATEQMILYGKHNDEAVCPWCGKTVTMKETGRLGKRKKLLEYHPVVYLKEQGGDLYARAYWARKDYIGELDAPPMFMLAGAYIFQEGKASYISTDFWSEKWWTVTLQGNYDPVHRRITEPFVEDCYGGYRYIGYTVFGLEEIRKSRFRYCQYEVYEAKAESAFRWDMMKYLAACCLYPRQIEMLMKTGFEGLVSDLVSGRRKNSRVITWGETDYLKAFGLNKQELQAWRDSGADAYVIGEYKALRNKKLWTSFEDLVFLQDEFYDYTKFLLYCRKRKLLPMRVCRYLSRFAGGCGSHSMTIRRAFEIWRDYLTMAEYLDYDLKDETVFWPRNLMEKHDEAAVEQRLKLLREQQEENERLRTEAAEALRTRKEKYNFFMEEYFIRVAETAEEIIQEGKTLKHCVGGYAERHMKGTTTILFLRRIATPEASLYTIEMQGNRLQQIHGYRNEMGTGAKPPKETMAWMLEPWLKWIQKGSPRDEQGNPKLPKHKKKQEEKIA